MSERLQSLLSERPWLLADGATGTNYFAAGLETGDPPELWNIDFPEKVIGLHRSFIDAGSDIILTNSFGGTRCRLKLHRAEERVREINRAAAAIARQVAEERGAALGRPVLVAGSMGPTGEIYDPIGPLSVEDGTAAYAEQAEALAEGGAEVLWIETISSVEELTAALNGARDTNLPIICTLSFDTNGRTMMGVTAAELARLAHELTPRPLGYGGNCGTGPAELMAVMVQLNQAKSTEDIIVAKSNCGVPAFVDGEIQYSGTPPLMAEYARIALDSGVRIIGGCCGTTATHIKAMREALEGHVPGTAPSIEEITARLGEISKGAAQQGPLDAPPERGDGGRRRRGRRRA